MLGKKIPLTILFCGLILPNFSLCKWQEHEVRAIINSNKWLLDNGQYFVLKDLLTPDLMFPSKNNECIVPALELFLRRDILNKRILITESDKSRRVRNRARFLSGEVKLKNNRLDIISFLIRQGWGDYNGNKKELLVLEDRAIGEGTGRWGSCNLYNDLNRRKTEGGDSLFFKAKPQFLSSVSVAWVEDVKNDKILLHNDIKVVILSVQNFMTGNEEIDQCINESREKYLKKILMGQKIFLEKDILQAQNHNTIYRHIWLPQNRHKSATFVSESLISEGLSLQSSTHKSRKNQERLIRAESSLLQKIPARLSLCLAGSKKAIKTDELEFDLACPIKGNIAGSKTLPKKTYHTPLSGWYKRIKSEKCFQDESEALLDGFRKIK